MSAGPHACTIFPPELYLSTYSEVQYLVNRNQWKSKIENGIIGEVLLLSFGFCFCVCFLFLWMKEELVLVGQSSCLEVLEDWGTCVPFCASLCSQPSGQHLPIIPWSESSSRSPEYMAALASRELVQTVMFTANERKPWSVSHPWPLGDSAEGWILSSWDYVVGSLRKKSHTSL